MVDDGVACAVAVAGACEPCDAEVGVDVGGVLKRRAGPRWRSTRRAERATCRCCSARGETPVS